MKINSPCYGCKKRCLLCHAHCKEYADYQAELKKQAKRSKADIDATTFELERSERIRRTQQERFDERMRDGLR